MMWDEHVDHASSAPGWTSLMESWVQNHSAQLE